MTMITVAPVKKSVVVKTPPERAFAVFTAEIGKWWPSSHSIGGAYKEAVLEPRAGGRWYERETDGRECEWGKVLAWEPPARLLLAWRINAKWAYDPKVGTEVELLFAELADGSTRVEFEHRHLEQLGEGAEETAGQLGGGWPTLLDLYKALAES